MTRQEFYKLTNDNIVILEGYEKTAKYDGYAPESRNESGGMPGRVDSWA